ncbi:MAG: hypothetical protein ABDI07_04730 [Candidatus Kryptonium sp.]
MQLKLILLLIFILPSILVSQTQQQYSVEDVIKKLEAMDNSLKENVNELRNEFDQKFNQITKRVSQVEAQNRDLRNRVIKVNERIATLENGINDVKKGVGEVNVNVKEVSTKIDENISKFDEIISKLGTNRATLIVGFIIVIILSAVIAVGVMNLSRLTKSVEKNIIDTFESSAGKIEVTTSDLRTIVDVLKQQTSEIVAYQRILEERIISAQQQIEAKLEEKLATRRRTQRKATSSE